MVQSPFHPGGLIVLCAGLSEASTLQICDSSLYDKLASYVVIQGKEELTRGDWKVDDGLSWKFE